MRFLVATVTAAALLTSLGIAQAAEDLSAQEVAKRALEMNLFATDNARATLDMDIEKKGKVVRSRRIATMMKRADGRTKAFVEFQTPADVAGTKFLSLEEADGDTQQFIYLPAFKKVKRIVGTQRNQSFMGTDFSYADLEGRDVEDSNWTKLADDQVEGESCYVVEAKPKKPDDEQYAKTVMWVHKKTYIPLKIDFFDKAGKEVKKRLVVKRVAKKDDRWITMDSVMETLKKNTATRLKVLSIDLRTEIPEDALTRAALER